MSYTYLAINRPPSEVTDPPDWTTRTDSWMGMITRCAFREDVHNFGYITYEKPLSFSEIQRLEWTPGNPVEWAHYEFWRQAEYDYNFANELEVDYVTAYMENRLHTSDHYYVMAMILAKFDPGYNKNIAV